MIDLHCHILPGIDFDGPPRLDDVLEMGRIAVADGIRKIVATPHIKETIHPVEFLGDQVRLLNEVFAKNSISLEVLQGAEVNTMIDPSSFGDYTLNGTDYVLLEFPHSHLPKNAIEIVFDAVLDGLSPIIPHPERNPSIVRRPELVSDLVKAGALIQLTADSLLGGFGPEARECSLYLLERGQVHLLATDAHSPDWRRPVLSRGVKAASRVLGEAEALRLVNDNPESILAGKSLHD